MVQYAQFIKVAFTKETAVFHRPQHFVAISCLTIILFAIAVVVNLAPRSSALAAPLSQEEPAVLVGAGDISECYNENDTYTAYLMDSIEGTVVALGDTGL